MKTIRLTKNQIALIDDEDYERISKYKWFAMWQPNIKSYYAGRMCNGKIMLMHREIMNTPQHLQCDHINHITLDNQKSNLANCTHAQNQANRNRANSNSKLGILGVYKSSNGNKFIACIKRNNKSKYIGTFDTLDEAIEARKAEIHQSR